MKFEDQSFGNAFPLRRQDLLSELPDPSEELQTALDGIFDDPEDEDGQRKADEVSGD